MPPSLNTYGADTILFVLVHKVIVEFPKAIHDTIKLIFRWQERGPKVPSTILLPKPWARNYTYSSRAQQFQAVESIRLLACSTSSLDCFWRQVNLWEGVHCTLCRVAAHPLQWVQKLSELLRTSFERLVNIVTLLLVQRKGLFSLLWGIYHETDLPLVSLFWVVHIPHTKSCPTTFGHKSTEDNLYSWARASASKPTNSE